MQNRGETERATVPAQGQDYDLDGETRPDGRLILRWRTWCFGSVDRDAPMNLGWTIVVDGDLNWASCGGEALVAR